MAFQFTDSYLQGVYETLCRKNAQEPEFLQAAGEVLESLQPVVAQRPELLSGTYTAFISINASDYNRYYGDRVNSMFAMKSYLDKGIITAIGSDAVDVVAVRDEVRP